LTWSSSCLHWKRLAWKIKPCLPLAASLEDIGLWSSFSHIYELLSYVSTVCKGLLQAIWHGNEKNLHEGVLETSNCNLSQGTLKLHKSVHSVDGLLGSLDWTHTHLLDELSQGMAEIVQRKRIKAFNCLGGCGGLCVVPLACIVWIHWNMQWHNHSFSLH
jgi:hypothetical protein